MQERLQKLIAQAGVASRRAAEELIRTGEVTVNGEIITRVGTKADPEKDHIKVSGKLINTKIQRRENTYVLLNKPKGYLSSAADPEGRKLVTDLVRGFGKLHPVGRLDFNTEGLIILTNDGQFTNHVASSKTIAKVYEVKVKGLPTPVSINKLRRGTILPDGFKTAPAEIKEFKSTVKNGWYEVTLYEGHNQQIRKMFDSIGHSVVKLRRIAIGNLTERGLPTGTYRPLEREEVDGIGDPPKPKKVKPAFNDSKPSKPDLPEHSRALKVKKTFKRTFVKPKMEDVQAPDKRRTASPKAGSADYTDSPKPKKDFSRPFGKYKSDDREPEKRPARGATSQRPERSDETRPKKDSNRTFSKPKVGEQGREKRSTRGAKPVARRSR